MQTVVVTGHFRYFEAQDFCDGPFEIRFEDSGLTADFYVRVETPFSEDSNTIIWSQCGQEVFSHGENVAISESQQFLVFMTIDVIATLVKKITDSPTEPARIAGRIDLDNDNALGLLQEHLEFTD